MNILLGKSDGHDIKIDLKTLMKTRLLIQANSGGGKSYLLRRLAEQLFGKVPVIIIDPEGEFATLREKFDYVLVGKGGETPASSKSASLVAHKLLELRASAVCDLYELKPDERHHWVKLFLEGLINAPKNLWQPTVVKIDEAHTFCPEGKAGESEASSAVIEMATKGRKRRFCLVLATQRLGKLRKDATAELLNRLVGPTFEDVDLDRAADLLSVPTGQVRKDFYAQMRVLSPGNFFALGRAICLERTLVKIGPIETSHEIEDSKFGYEPPPPPEKIRALLPKLADLPKESEEKARTESELRREIGELKRQLKAVPAPVQVKPQIKEIEVITPQQIKALSDLAADFENLCGAMRQASGEILQAVTKIRLQQARPVTAVPTRPKPVAAAPVVNGKEDIRRGYPVVSELASGERRILVACIQYPKGLYRGQLTTLTGFKRSTRNTYLQRLQAKGLVNLAGDTVMATDLALDTLPDAEPLPTGTALQEFHRGRLPQGELAILEVLLKAYPDAVDRETLSELTNYKRSTRNTYLDRLRSKELITEPTRGQVRASDTLFEE